MTNENQDPERMTPPHPISIPCNSYKCSAGWPNTAIETLRAEGWASVATLNEFKTVQCLLRPFQSAQSCADVANGLQITSSFLWDEIIYQKGLLEQPLSVRGLCVPRSENQTCVSWRCFIQVTGLWSYYNKICELLSPKTIDNVRGSCSPPWLRSYLIRCMIYYMDVCIIT